MVAVGTSLIVAEILKASGVEGAEQICDLIQDIIHFGKLPQLNGRRASSSPSTRARVSPLSEEIIKASNGYTRS